MEGGIPTCEVCYKTFQSAKALHGHMRTHPEREWRGVNKPPMIDCDLNQLYEDEAFIECFLPVKKMSSQMHAAGSSSSSGGVRSPPKSAKKKNSKDAREGGQQKRRRIGRKVVKFDLNDPPVEK